MNTSFSVTRNNDKKLAIWLLFCAGVIFCMVILGGVTRLTGSGLSIVEWQPIMGVIPPLNEKAWQAAFEQYQQYPQYKLVNHQMSLTEFQFIFYFEYFHRLLGRLIGVAFLLPFLFFLARGMIKKPLIPRLAIMFALGGLQGLLGWYMVKSGLVKDPHVSQYRLTAHLTAAVIIYVYMLWVAFGLLNQGGNKNHSPSTPPIATTLHSRFYSLSILVVSLIIVMIMSGGLVAGTKAGLAYNTFPLMEGYFIPPNLFALQPFWINAFENITTVQFNHRMLAYVLMTTIPIFAFNILRHGTTPRCRNAAFLLIAMLVIQVSLGIATLLNAVPVSLGAAHQGGAIVLLTIALYIARELKPSSTSY